MKHQQNNNCTLFKQSCWICREPSNTSICSICLANLPWLQAHCHQCALPLTTHQRLCAKCITAPPAFDKVEAVFSYEFPINQVLPHCKRIKGVEQISWLTHLLYSQLLSTPREWPEVLIPVPSHWTRSLTRGFNPPSLIAQELGKKLGIPVSSDRLKKTRSTRHQSGLSAKERARNLHQSFDYSGESFDHIALIDDVVTTGTTVEEISQVLRRSGIKRIDIWALARTPEPDSHQ